MARRALRLYADEYESPAGYPDAEWDFGVLEARDGEVQRYEGNQETTEAPEDAFRKGLADEPESADGHEDETENLHQCLHRVFDQCFENDVPAVA